MFPSQSLLIQLVFFSNSVVLFSSFVVFWITVICCNHLWIEVHFSFMSFQNIFSLCCKLCLEFSGYFTLKSGCSHLCFKWPKVTYCTPERCGKGFLQHHQWFFIPVCSLEGVRLFLQQVWCRRLQATPPVCWQACHSRWEPVGDAQTPGCNLGRAPQTRGQQQTTSNCLRESPPSAQNKCFSPLPGGKLSLGGECDIRTSATRNVELTKSCKPIS